jgi:hypothetical protein
MARPDTKKVYGARPLLLGCEKGLDVWELQVKLIGWGSGTKNDDIGNVMDPVRLTGEFNSTTRDAVMRFQKGHKLPITGIVDGPVFLAIDREVALHPVMMHSLRCPCVTGANDGPILCRCTKHDGAGKCTDDGGFGKARSADKFLLDSAKLADDTDLKDEKLDVYDMQEYAGMDKTVLWAVRAVLHRSERQLGTDHNPLQVVAGYQCWEDNYHDTDDTRWHHRRSTFHFGKAIEFYLRDYCTQTAWVDTATSCPQCDLLRTAALEKCGFQLRWQEPGRVSLGEGGKEKRPPANPFAVHIDTVLLHPRKSSDHKLEYTDHFVKTDKTAAAPLYGGTLVDVSFPLALEAGVDDAWPLPDDPGEVLDIRRALDPKFASSEEFFRNTETGPGGWYPLGLSRIWHGGVHLYADAGTPVHAIADGEIVGCRAGQLDTQQNGSRNFVLIRHTIQGDDADPWKDKVFWSLYMHLDGEAPAADAKIRWRKELFARSKKCAVAQIPTPVLEKKTIDTKDRLVPKAGLVVGEARAVSGAEIVAKTIDDLIPDAWKVIALDGLVDHYVFTTQGADTITEIQEALATITDGKVRGFEKPIRVAAGEVIGYIGKAATADPAKKLKSFLHLETFSEAKLPVKDFTDVTVSAVAKLADRKDAVKTLAGATLFPAPPDGVLTAEELKRLYLYPPYSTALRSALVTMPSCWSVDWKTAVSGSKSLGFLADPDTMTDDWKSYNWWEDVKTGKGKLPSDDTKVFHYHPIALILQLAYR